MGVEIDVLAQEVRAVADAGEGRCEHLVAFPLKRIGHPPPAPAAVPGAVHQHECLLLRLCLGGAGEFTRRGGCQKSRAGGDGSDRAAAGDAVVGRHDVLPCGVSLPPS